MSMRTYLTPLLAFACISAVFLAGCSGPGVQPLPTPAPTPAPTQAPVYPAPNSFSQTDNGGTYNVSLDEEFELRLPENPTTGYTWVLSVTDGLSISNETYLPDDTSGKLVGSGGTRVWSLKAVQPGVQTISGIYSRPWESRRDASTLFFNLTLIVGESSCGSATCPVEGVSARFHVYTEGDTGTTVQEGHGETFNIRLRENPTTGYSWNLSISDGLGRTRDEYIPSQVGGQIVGGGGIHSFYFVTTNAGEQKVMGEYRRPWLKSGTITRVDLEGGFFGIMGDDGKKYDPLNLDARFQKDGLRVAFDAEPVKDMASIHMWGTMVNLVQIEEIPGFTLTVMVV